MSTKAAVMLGMTVGSFLGELVPGFFGAGFLSYWGIIGSGVGGVLGIFIMYKLFN